jgi:hypothetical protein
MKGKMLLVSLKIVAIALNINQSIIGYNNVVLLCFDKCNLRKQNF